MVENLGYVSMLRYSKMITNNTKLNIGKDSQINTKYPKKKRSC